MDQCTAKARRRKSLPSFHTGSILKMIVDRTDTAKNQMTVTISIMKTGQSFRANFQADKRAHNNVVPFVSMYNKGARIKILDNHRISIGNIKLWYKMCAIYLCILCKT